MTNRVNVLVMLLKELAQDLMLIAYESNSSRVQSSGSSVVFKGFSGEASLDNVTGVLQVILVDERPISSDQINPEHASEENLNKMRKMASEMMQVYRYAVLSGVE